MKAPSGIHETRLITLNTQWRPITLPRDSLIRVIRGQIWVTEEGVLDDIILVAGQSLALRARGMVLAAATQTPAVVMIASSLRVPASSHEHY